MQFVHTVSSEQTRETQYGVKWLNEEFSKSSDKLNE